ncbi:MAG: phospholipid carrier-dependent glycosyltransferase, partial [Candidatus Dadabacteria bacterium]
MESESFGYRRRYTILVLLGILSGLLSNTAFVVGNFYPLSHPYFQYLLFSAVMLLFITAFLALFWGVLLFFNNFFLFLLSIAITGFFIFSVLLVSLSPPTAIDALIHHLAVPKWWLEGNSLQPIEWHDWSFYPMLAQLGFLFFFIKNILPFVSLYHASFGAAFAGLSALFIAYTFKSRLIGGAVFLLVLTTPLFFRLSTEPLVDLALAFFSAVAFFELLLYQKGERKTFILSAIAMGLACSVKYNGFLALFLIVFSMASAWGSSGKGVFKYLLFIIFYLCFSLAIASPWLVRNLIERGNPFYPLYKKSFGSVSAVPSYVKSPKPISKRILLYKETPLDIVLTPV